MSNKFDDALTTSRELVVKQGDHIAKLVAELAVLRGEIIRITRERDYAQMRLTATAAQLTKKNEIEEDSAREKLAEAQANLQKFRDLAVEIFPMLDYRDDYARDYD